MFDVPSGRGVTDCRRRLPVLVVPPTGSAVQVRDLFRALIQQVRLRDVAEVVVAEVPVDPERAA